ncbi:Nitrate ABC transporter, nitrate-binding protein [Cronobacter condimenti 1330]|nr:Nitrate ABC transporter, nitrate-binding protein [Cronobacter condimenti 1330]
MWFLTQFRRWGLLKTDPDYAAIAARINRTDIYEQAAQAVGGITLPETPLRTSRLMDGSLWDGRSPAAYANSFAMKR